jgi:hypothetical protein
LAAGFAQNHGMRPLAVAGVVAALVALLVGVAGRAGARVGGTRVVVGPGIAEDTVRQVVRTAGQVVYVFAPDDTAQRQNAGPGTIRAYRGNRPGVPTAFAEVDARHHPVSSGVHVLYAPDVRLDRRGIAHLVYVDQATDRLYYQTFSTLTDRWGARAVLGGGAVANPGFYATPSRVFRNWASYGVVLDARDRPHVVYCSGNAVLARVLTAHGWTKPRQIALGRSPQHVQLAADERGAVYATWLDDPLGGASVMYAHATAAGVWSKPQVVDHGSPAVLNDSTDDQGPSIVVTRSGTPYVLYLRGTLDRSGKAESTAVVRYLRAGTWHDDSPPSSGYGITHSPQLYSRGNDVYVFLGHDARIHWGYLVQRAGHGWSPYVVLDASMPMDGSSSVRWDPQRDHDAAIIDAVHHSEDVRGDRSYLPQLYYQAVTP